VGTAASTNEALRDPTAGAVVIASSTDSHAELIELAAKAGKAIFCEKPIDLDMGRLDRCLGLMNANSVPLMLGFNRRFDRNFLSLQQSISAGDIGRLGR
jgi:myo-inositol 2-dehydrogenase/D-chiro-inositol 1-dehydrogenase